MGMKKKSKDQGYFIEANGGGAQHTGSGGGVDGIQRWSCCIHCTSERMGYKGEEIGRYARRGKRASGHVHKKKKERRGRGARYEG